MERPVVVLNADSRVIDKLDQGNVLPSLLLGTQECIFATEMIIINADEGTAWGEVEVKNWRRVYSSSEMWCNHLWRCDVETCNEFLEPIVYPKNHYEVLNEGMNPPLLLNHECRLFEGEMIERGRGKLLDGSFVSADNTTDIDGLLYHQARTQAFEYRKSPHFIRAYGILTSGQIE